MEKKGVFFSIDALIALVLISGLIVVSYSVVTNNKTKTEVQNDIIRSLSTLKAGESADPLTQSLVTQGFINENKSLLEAIGEVYVTNRTRASEILSNNLQGIETNYDWGIWYGNTLLFSKNVTPLDAASQIDVARGFVSGVKEGDTVTGFSSRAFLSTNHKVIYKYLGGYVGDGNISLDIEYQGNITEAVMELAINNISDVYLNGNFVTSLSASPNAETPQTYNLPLGQFVSGVNTLELRGKNLYIAGGFVKIKYLSGLEYESSPRYYFPGIEGIVNIYDGLYIPGILNSMNLFLHYNSNNKLMLVVGNTTIFNESSTDETTISRSNVQLSQLLNYQQLSDKTVPLRLGLENNSYQGGGVGTFDVVLITDTSGSMDWRLNSDTTGTTRSCNDANLYSSTTKRISLAKCLDQQFISTIINASSLSRVALIGFSNDADNYIGLTRDTATLNAEVNSYSASGGTCVSCAINRAYEILRDQSSNASLQFIVVMTDGVANVRSTSTCTDLLSSGGKLMLNKIGSSSGVVLNRSTFWKPEAELSTPVNDIEMYNETLGFAVGNGGIIRKWNGASWITQTSPVTSDMNGVDIYNATFALAVGDSGKVLKWNGASWSTAATLSGSPTLNAVSILNQTFAMTAGTMGNQGKVYRTINMGASWTQDLSTGTNFRGVKIISSTVGFAVGNNGIIRKWNGASWSSQTSPTGDALYSVDGINSTVAYAVGGDNGQSVIARWNGASWSLVYEEDTEDSLRDISVENNTRWVAVGDGGNSIEYDGTSWAKNLNIPIAYEGNNTSGISCTLDNDECTEISSYPALNANYSACRARSDLGATLYSVGFGPISSCNFATQTLQRIATCGNGTMYTSSSASELQEFYETIAYDIIEVSYNEQTSQTLGNVSTRLYPDSYIEFNYTKPESSYGLVVSVEVPFTNATSGLFIPPANTTITEAQLISYSGKKWTTRATINNHVFYNLNNYGPSYALLGDPYAINIPLSLINTTNVVTLETGISSTNSSAGSPYNKIIYKAVRNVTGYSPIVLNAQGCVWTVDTEQGTNVSFRTPLNYGGPNLCYYQASRASFDPNDAIQYAASDLFRALDLDSDYRIDIPINEDDVLVGVNEVTGIPFSWSTEVQVRVWR